MAGPFLDLQGLTTFKNCLDGVYTKFPSLHVDTPSANSYNCIKEYDATPAWRNYRDVFVISSRHIGSGLLCVNISHDTSDTPSTSNVICGIRYFGLTNEDGGDNPLIMGDQSFMLYLGTDNATVRLVVGSTDYNSFDIVQLAAAYQYSSLKDGGNVGSIPASWGSLLAKTNYEHLKAISSSYINGLV